MEPFNIKINGTVYSISLDVRDPEIFLVSNPRTLHRIGKNMISGEYVAISHRPFSEPIPLKEIGEKIDEIYIR